MAHVLFTLIFIVYVAGFSGLSIFNWPFGYSLTFIYYRKYKTEISTFFILQMLLYK